MTRLPIPVTAEQVYSCVAIGNFDGVHLGHSAMLRELRHLASELDTSSVAVTFDPHPIAVLRPEFTPPVLTAVDDRIELLHASGADSVIVLPVTRALLELTAEQFFQNVIVDTFHARGVVEGPNFRFGKNRAGDTAMLERYCQQAAIAFRVVNAVEADGQLISSSRIRELICKRSLRQATQLLGHSYRITGIVGQGAGRGATIGFPTANLSNVETLLPAHGVYAGQVVFSGIRYPAAVSIGPNPTFGEHREKVECHLHDFHGELYGQTLHLDLLSEVRPLESFQSVDALVRQIREDIEVTCKIVEQSCF